MALVAIGAALWWAFSANETGPHRGVSPVQQMAAQQYTGHLSEESFSVQAHGYRSTKFDIPPGSFNERFDGNFSATGGTGNDIETYIFDADDFVNWQNRHPARTFYNSGRVTQGTVNVSLPPGGGTYYVVFSNIFSVFTPKDVEAHITLTYSK